MEQQAEYIIKTGLEYVDPDYYKCFNADFLKTIEMLMEKKSFGVYVFSIEDTPFYVGMSVNLGSRIITSYFERFCLDKKFFFDRRDRPYSEDVYIQYIELERKSDLLIFESYLIATLKPTLNKGGIYNDYPSVKLNVPAFSQKIKIINKLTDEYKNHALSVVKTKLYSLAEIKKILGVEP